VHFQEIGAVHDERDHVAHVVAGLGFQRHHVVERGSYMRLRRVRRAADPPCCWRAESESRRLQISAASTSFSATKCTTPELVHLGAHAAQFLAVTISPVTCLITVGPVMNISPSRVWMMKSVSAGLYAAPPAQGPQIMRDLRHQAGEHHVLMKPCAHSPTG
jgi:hypothetical protein